MGFFHFDYLYFTFLSFVNYFFLLNFCVWENQFELNSRGSFKKSEKLTPRLPISIKKVAFSLN